MCYLIAPAHSWCLLFSGNIICCDVNSMTENVAKQASLGNAGIPAGKTITQEARRPNWIYPRAVSSSDAWFQPPPGPPSIHVLRNSISRPEQGPAATAGRGSGYRPTPACSVPA